MTEIIIYIIFGLIIAIDIPLAIRQSQGSTKWITISRVFQRWYKQALVPYLVSALFVGHFAKWIPLEWMVEWLRLTIFIGFSLWYIIWCAWEYQLKKVGEEHSRIYQVFCDNWIIPFCIGSVMGCFFS